MPIVEGLAREMARSDCFAFDSSDCTTAMEPAGCGSTNTSSVVTNSAGSATRMGRADLASEAMEAAVECQLERSDWPQQFHCPHRMASRMAACRPSGYFRRPSLDRHVCWAPSFEVMRLDSTNLNFPNLPNVDFLEKYKNKILAK